jgi:hypothetical protein
VVTCEALETVLQALCACAAHELVQLGHAAWRLDLELVDEHGQGTVRTRRFPRPLRDADALSAAARTLVRRSAFAQPVAALRLHVPEHGPVQASQPTLFAETRAVRQREREQLGELLARYAPGRVVRVVEHCPAAPLPELRWRLAGSDVHPLAGEPVQLCRSEHGSWLAYGGRWLRIVRGGRWERIDLWWPETRHRRIFWVELADGQRFLLCWETSDRTWRLVGRLD